MLNPTRSRLHPESPARRISRWIIGLGFAAGFVWLLTQIPYAIIRQERFRMFGETRTMGLVLAKKELPEGFRGARTRWLVGYQYLDKDGFLRQGTAFVPEPEWRALSQGDRVPVWFPDTKPALSRMEGEVEPAFQLWLRHMLE